jgi:transketolase
MRNVFIQELIKEARKDKRIVLVTADLGYGVVDKFEKEFPDRFFNLGIAEQSIMSIAAALASKGLRPFVYSIGNFPTFRCMEQIRNDVSYMGNGVVIVALGAGFSYGTAGYSHYLIEDIAAMRSFENIEIFNPATTSQVAGITSYLAGSNNPGYLRLGSLEKSDLSLPIDTTQSIQSVATGSDGKILVTGPLISIAMKARELLGKLGTNVGIDSVFNLTKFDFSLYQGDIRLPIICLEEHKVHGGFYSIALESALKNFPSPLIGSVGIRKFSHSTVGKRDFMLQKYNISPEAVVDEFQRISAFRGIS